jgi:EmrB/QacA subfamily drug resistance transporter
MDVPMVPDLSKSKTLRGLLVCVVCLGVLMIMLDSTIVIVALPSLQTSLHLDQSSLVWVSNAYLVGYGGTLLLAGRLGDVYGLRRIFLGGILLFTIASMACARSTSLMELIAARSLQGVSGAAIVSATLPLLTIICDDAKERSHALGFYSFACSFGGSVGFVLGGIITSTWGWQWNFLCNLPIGVIVLAAAYVLIPNQKIQGNGQRVGLSSALAMVTLSLSSLILIGEGGSFVLTSAKDIGLLTAGVVSVAWLVSMKRHANAAVHSRAALTSHNVVVTYAIRILWSAAASGYLFIATLYLQALRGLNPVQVGVAFVPTNGAAALLAIVTSSLLMGRYELKWLLTLGLFIVGTGIGVFATQASAAAVMSDILLGTIIAGIGSGIALVPLLSLALRDVSKAELGVVSGILNTVSVVGGALGIAVSSEVAASRSSDLLISGARLDSALSVGYRNAFIVDAAMVGLAMVLAACALKSVLPLEAKRLSNLQVLRRE